jgi:hypothetical protein
MSSLPSVDLTTLYAPGIFSPRSSLAGGRRKVGGFPADVDKAQSNIEQKGNQNVILTGWRNPPRGL